MQGSIRPEQRLPLAHNESFMSAAAKLGFVLCLLMAAASCSSSNKQEEETAGIKVSSLDRFMNKGYDRRQRDWNHDMRSRYDQKSFSADKRVKSREFKTNNFAGKHDYSGSEKFKSSEFKQADKDSALANQTFGQSEKAARDSGQGFDAKTSRYDNQQSTAGDEVYSGADERFKTRAVSDAAKSQKKNTRPVIIHSEPDRSKSTYDEADIKRMINRN